MFCKLTTFECAGVGVGDEHCPLGVPVPCGVHCQHGCDEDYEALPECRWCGKVVEEGQAYCSLLCLHYHDV
jgi:hypothetical protein